MVMSIRRFRPVNGPLRSWADAVKLTRNATVTIGGQSSTLTPTKKTAGVIQVDAKIPGGIQTGSAVPVVVQVGNTSSQAGVTIAVR